jgi:hypothetical protein
MCRGSPPALNSAVVKNNVFSPREARSSSAVSSWRTSSSSEPTRANCFCLRDIAASAERPGFNPRGPERKRGPRRSSNQS